MSQNWALLTLLGLYGWILSTVAFILKSFPPNGGFISEKGIKYGTFIVVFFSIWIIGMLKA